MFGTKKKLFGFAEDIKLLSDRVYRREREVHELGDRIRKLEREAFLYVPVVDEEGNPVQVGRSRGPLAWSQDYQSVSVRDALAFLCQEWDVELVKVKQSERLELRERTTE